MPKRKCSFTDALKAQYPGFRAGRYEWEAELTKNSRSVPSVAVGGGASSHVCAASSGAKFRSATNVRESSAAARSNGSCRDPEAAIDGAGDSSIRPISRRDICSGSTLVLTQLGPGGDVTDAGLDDRGMASVGVEPKTSARMRLLTDYVTLITDPRFFLPCIANLFGAIGLFIPFVYLVKRAEGEDLNVEPTKASFLISVIGITNTLGRLLAGFLADFKFVNTLLLHNTALVFAGVSCVLIVFCVNYPLMCAFAAFFGLCIATWISLTSVVLCDLLGLQRLTNAFSLLTMTRGIATVIGSPMAGSLFDLTEDYNSTFYLGGASMIVGGLICGILHLPCYRTATPPPGAPRPLTDKVADRTAPPEYSMVEANETKEPLLEQSAVRV